MRHLLFLFLVIVLTPTFLSANGGDQRVVENKYLINFSRAPFTPRIGIKTSFLASFVDIQKNKLISEDLIARVRIARLGGSDKREFLFEKNDVKVSGGVLDFSYTFVDAGLHEIFFDFVFASNPQKVYEAPDFLLDVQNPVGGYSISKILIAVLGSFATGLLTGWFVKKR